MKITKTKLLLAIEIMLAISFVYYAWESKETFIWKLFLIVLAVGFIYQALDHV